MRVKKRGRELRFLKVKKNVFIGVHELDTRFYRVCVSKKYTENKC